MYAFFSFTLGLPTCVGLGSRESKRGQRRYRLQLERKGCTENVSGARGEHLWLQRETEGRFPIFSERADRFPLETPNLAQSRGAHTNQTPQ